MECSFVEDGKSETKKKKNKDEKINRKIGWEEMVDDSVKDKMNENMVKGSL